MLSFRAVKRSNAVYDHLEQAIASGHLAPGSRLPAERALADQMGVSRNSVREAVHELELKGILERRAGQGTVVLVPDSGPRSRLIDELAPGDREVLEIMDFRLTIEPPIAALAAERHTRGSIARLARLLDEMEDETRVDRIAELDREFHGAVARATNNRLLVRLSDVTALWLRQSRHETLQTRTRRAASLAGHRRIYEAIQASDAATARSAMTDHIEQVRRIIAANPTKVR